ncbi:MAG TPA: MmgE/PrpD family protein [Vicinamibacterales bacterium]|nr:MmgE/PrpD family protein [Vicinamibacterales bacterium]
MIRRDFFKTPLALAGLTMRPSAEAAAAAAGEELAQAPGLTRYVAEFITGTRYEDVPDEVVALGKKTLLDGFGLALAGSASVVAPVVRQYIGTLGVTGKSSTVVGTAMKVPARFAAFANGVSIHADDYDDTGSALHIAAPVLPPVFALCEEGRRSGRDLMLAFHVGVEAASKIGDAIFPRHDREGFHTTGTIGSFGSAAACAKLRGLTVAQTAYALGIAASQAGGIRRNFGSMTKAFHAGHAAENGSVATDLAALGFTAASDVLETPLGFFQAAGGGFNPAAIVNRLGRPWMFASPGDLIKRFPCGTIQQPVMDATLRLIAQHGIKAADVERAEVGGNQSNVNTLFRHRPTTGLEAKFSMEFAVAILLVDGKAGLGQFTDASVRRAEVQDMTGRVRYYADPEFDTLGRDGAFQAVLEEPAVVKMYMKDGRLLTTRTEPAKGSPKNPMTYEDVADKFRTNAEFARWPPAKTESIITLVRSLERAPNMAALTAALTT